MSSSSASGRSGCGWGGSCGAGGGPGPRARRRRRVGSPVVAVDDREEGENVGHARESGLPVVIGRGADPSLLRRLSLDRAIALAAVTNDALENIAVPLAARAIAPDLRFVLRAGANATAGETR